jgi:hypothetical protein
MEKRVLKLLYRSLDRSLTENEERRLDRALAESEELRRLREDLLALRRAVADGAGPSFGPQFADRVINRWSASSPAAQPLDAVYDSYRLIFKRLAVASLLILVILVSYAVVQDGLWPQDAFFYVSDLTIAEILRLPVF